jgi:hypothetical protein
MKPLARLWMIVRAVIEALTGSRWRKGRPGDPLSKDPREAPDPPRASLAVAEPDVGDARRTNDNADVPVTQTAPREEPKSRLETSASEKVAAGASSSVQLNPQAPADDNIKSSPSTSGTEPESAVFAVATDDESALLTEQLASRSPASRSTALEHIELPEQLRVEEQVREAPVLEASAMLGEPTASPDSVNGASEAGPSTTSDDASSTPHEDERRVDTSAPIAVESTPVASVGLAEETDIDEEEPQDLLDEFDEEEDDIASRAQRPASHRRPPTWERRPEPSTAFPTAAFPPPTSAYYTWNRALAEHLLLKTATGTDLYLTITPRILARAFAEIQGATLSPEDAQEHFAKTISDSYRARVLANRARLRILRRIGSDGLPECIGFLAVTVLAAYRMHGDDEATGLAYYLRLAELLQCDLSGPYPFGFDPLVFESLWYFLRDWLAQRDRKLVVPAPQGGTRRFVGLPLAHVPLRSLDIEKLPGFFVWAGYQPSTEVTTEQLSKDFTRWVRARGTLTPTGAAAFADARRNAVLAEIRAEFDSWDGTCDETVGRRSASVEILFDPVQNRPNLFYVPRRPLGFPAQFNDGVHVFEGSDDGWYGRESIAPQDGSELANGFVWHALHSGVEFALRRASASVISLGPSDDYSYSGFMSARGLRKNVQCAVLCNEDVVQAVSEYLSDVAERRCMPFRHQNLPAGWSLFPGVVARRLAETPAGLESLEVQANVGLIPAGGIRLGNRWSWLQGAAPRIIIAGSEPGLPVTIDGSPAAVDPDGLVQSESSLTTLGAHVIQVGVLRRTVEIVEASLHVNSEHATESVEGSAPAVLVLPPGQWIVVGAIPGQVARPKHALRNGAIVHCSFAPSWAIRIGTNRGGTILNVSPSVPSVPKSVRGMSVRSLSSRDILAWTSSIYTASVQHPQIDSLIAERDQVSLATSWKAYVQCARQIKRTIRRARR